MNFIPTFYPKVKYLIIFARLLSGLVNEIVAAVADPLMDTGDNFAGFLSFTAPVLLFCEFAL